MAWGRWRGRGEREREREAKIYVNFCLFCCVPKISLNPFGSFGSLVFRCGSENVNRVSSDSSKSYTSYTGTTAVFPDVILGHQCNGSSNLILIATQRNKKQQGGLTINAAYVMAFWVTTRFRWLPASTLKTEAEGSSEMLVTTCHIHGVSRRTPAAITPQERFLVLISVRG
jgi:hypothetical protein